MSLIDEFEACDLERVKRYCSDREQEDLLLEFKTVGGSDLRHRDDRRNLAKAISGFANSAGGLVVWGVLAKRNSDGLDCAHELRPIEDIAMFESRLNELTAHAAIPIVDYVKHKFIPDSGSSGYAITLVPESDRQPHMAKLGEDRYYKRSGSSFIRLEHHDLDDMFGRRPHPNLKLSYRVARGGYDAVAGRNSSWDHQVVLSIENCGRGSAVAPHLAILLRKPWRELLYGIGSHTHPTIPKIPRHEDDLWITRRAGRDTIIHAGLSMDVCAFACDVIAPGGTPPVFELPYKLSAVNLRLVEDSLIITTGDLIKLEMELRAK